MAIPMNVSGLPDKSIQLEAVYELASAEVNRGMGEALSTALRMVTPDGRASLELFGPGVIGVDTAKKYRITVRIEEV